MAIDRTGAGADAPLGAGAERRTAGDGFLASRGMRDPGSPRDLSRGVVRQGKKVGDGRCGPGARGEAVLRPDWPITGRTESGRPEPGRTETPRAPPRRPTSQRGRQPPAPAPPRAHPGPPPTAQMRTTTRAAPPASGQTVPSRLPAWTGRRAKDGTRESALLGQAPHGIDPAPCHQPCRGRLPRPHQHDSGDRYRGDSPRGGR